MTPEQKQLYKTIDEILWKDWDPIGVNDMPEASGEYRGYTKQVFAFKTRNASAEEIAHLLHSIETETMGLIGDTVNAHCVAQKIFNL